VIIRDAAEFRVNTDLSRQTMVVICPVALEKTYVFNKQQQKGRVSKQQQKEGFSAEMNKGGIAEVEHQRWPKPSSSLILLSKKYCLDGNSNSRRVSKLNMDGRAELARIQKLK
jgi:hypothetical protein